VPELPDVEAYVDAIAAHAGGTRLQRVRLASPFVLRSVVPPLTDLDGRRLDRVERLGKRIVLGFEGDLYLVVHLMIAGRFRWRPPGAALARKLGLAALDFEQGTLLLTEAGSKRRASIRVVSGRASLAALDPGGLEVFEATIDAFAEALTRENHTLKRSLTDPRLLSGIGNAYSDEILHRARLSPLRQTRQLTTDEMRRLFAATRAVLREWTERLRAEARTAFPEKVTAFRPDMAVHGKYGQPCPVCRTPVQRIVYADNECNYCPQCQTGGRLLADRALSRLLGRDWPRSLDDFESHLASRRERAGEHDP
jgi:formamidopyrimidine-DNA glycosylase